MTAAGLRLRVARHGAGRPLLLITGIGAHLDMWAPFARHAGERELIAFDPPGAGLSQRPRRPAADDRSGRVVTRAAGRARRSSASTCSATRSAAGSRRSSRTGRPSACGGSCCARPRPGLGGSPPKPIAALMLATPARYYHPRLLELSLPHIAGGRTAREPGVAGRARRRAPAAPALAARLRLPALRGRRLVEPAVAAPRVAADARRVGRGRPERPAAQRPHARRAPPDARLHVVRGGGHLFLLDEPERAAPAIRAFLDEVDPSRSWALTTRAPKLGSGWG